MLKVRHLHLFSQTAYFVGVNRQTWMFASIPACKHKQTQSFSDKTLKPSVIFTSRFSEG